MLLAMFTVFDAKASAYMQPFFSRNTATAIRSFEVACNDESHEFNLHAFDYTLFEIGEFDQEHCTLKPTTPVSIARAHELIQRDTDAQIPQIIPNNSPQNSETERPLLRAHPES